MKIALSEIAVGTRHRKDLGDLEALSQSIRELGLLQPIGVDSQRHLVWGQRRLEACRMLGWQEIDATVDPSFDDILRAMKAEAEENVCRKPFTPTEAVAITEHIESVERQQASERQKAAQAKPGQRVGAVGGAESAPPTQTPENRDISNSRKKMKPAAPAPRRLSAKTRNKVAAAVGMSHDTLTKARKVVAQGTPELVEAMDQGTASIHAAAQLSDLPPEEQRAIVAGGKEAITAAVTGAHPSLPKRPGLAEAFARLEALAAMNRLEFSLTALREVVRDLRKELGSLLS